MGAHDLHVRVEIWQGPLDFAELVVARGVAAGGRPDLEEVVIAQVREVLFPGRGHVHEVLLIELVIVVAVRPVGPLVLFALVPEQAADAVGEFGADHAVVEVGVNVFAPTGAKGQEWLAGFGRC